MTDHLEICSHCGKPCHPKFKHHECNLCKYCPIYHPTEKHKCPSCGAIGEKSHSLAECPNRCKYCSEKHKTEQHKCIICGLIGKKSHPWYQCPEQCRHCSHPHKTKDHRCSSCGLVGEESHEWTDCPESMAYSTKEEMTNHIADKIRKNDENILYQDEDQVMCTISDPNFNMDDMIFEVEI